MVEYYDPIEKRGLSYHLNQRLKENIDVLNARRKKRDQDQLWIVDGAEGSGKSVFAFQLAKYINPFFSLKNVCFSPEEFRDAIKGASKGDVIVFDEAFTGLSSKATLSKINRILVSLIQQMRQKNLWVFVVLPSIFLLEKYVAQFRAKCLLHVIVLKNQKRMWTLFNTKNKQDLILEGAKTYNYGKTIKKNRIQYQGNFYNIYAINEEQYRKKKMEAFEKNEGILEDDKSQRNEIIYILYKEYELNPYQIADLFKKYEFKLSRGSVQVILSKLKKEKEVKTNETNKEKTRSEEESS